MDLPLVLISRGETRLVYGIPTWYRAVMAAILLILVAAVAVDGQEPSLLGWVFLALLLLALLYEERWDFDKERDEIRHRYGFLVAARRLSFRLSGVESFRLVPWMRGSIPGSADELRENEGTLSESRGAPPREADPAKRRPIYKKPYLSLVFDAAGQPILVNMVPGRKGAKLRAVATRIADFCGKSLVEG